MRQSTLKFAVLLTLARRIEALKTGNHWCLKLEKTWAIDHSLSLFETQLQKELACYEPAVAQHTSGGTEWFCLETDCTFQQVDERINRLEKIHRNGWGEK